MKFKNYLYILFFGFSVFSLACGAGETASEQRSEVIIDDGYKGSSGDEVVIDERDLNLQTSTTAKNFEEISRILKDGSELIVKYDGYGNKTETRRFKNHPRISTILIRTAVNGKRRFYIYGYGDVKTPPAEMMDKALTASADDLANAAGLYEERSDEEIVNFRVNVPKLQPMPSYNFPIQSSQTVPFQTEEIIQDAEPSEDISTNAAEEDEPTAKNRQPESEN